jgi:DNA-binding NarL/FixJ family response regulator
VWPKGDPKTSHAILSWGGGSVFNKENFAMPLRILIADDHDVMRHGIRELLGERDDWEVCAEARDGREAVEKAEQHKPDIAILDVNMPALNGIEAARRIRKRIARTEVLIISFDYSDHLIRQIVDAGARGFVVKGDSERDLITAVEALANHRSFFTSRATDIILGRVRVGDHGDIQEFARNRLTSREREIVQLLAEGKSSKEAAESLTISVKTVDTHRANIMRKLDLHSVTELVRYAVRNQIVKA